MKKNEKATVKKDGRGGARPGAGRKPNPFETQQMHIDTPLELLEGMDRAGITNRTAYVVGLIRKDLKKKK